jgi:hypothetical protein
MDIRLSISISPSPQSPPAPLSHTLSSTSMPPPPEAIYSSKEELYTLIQAWAAQHRYAFCIARSKRISNSPRTKIIYNCDRYGPPLSLDHPQDSLQARKRQITTRKTSCQFSIVAIEHIDGQRELRYRPGTEYSVYNYCDGQSPNLATVP